MTKIDITISEPRYAIVLDGHATGSPEVCSGISALIYSLVGFLDNNEELLFLKSVKLDRPGWGYVMFELEDPSPKVKGAWEMLIIGLLQIQNTYPDYCDVTIKDVSKK